jgi:hypothetical protein
LVRGGELVTILGSAVSITLENMLNVLGLGITTEPTVFSSKLLGE